MAQRAVVYFTNETKTNSDSHISARIKGHGHTHADPVVAPLLLSQSVYMEQTTALL